MTPAEDMLGLAARYKDQYYSHRRTNHPQQSGTDHSTMQQQCQHQSDIEIEIEFFPEIDPFAKKRLRAQNNQKTA